MANLEQEITKRRTFAIISHPDAGKTTLTEKFLLYGGAIHLAGAIKAKKTQRHTTSDWMDLEKQRGISISTTVLQFEYNGHIINLLDTPGHQDFSEDTYRTLMAADSAVMLIDGAKGVEPQTIKLFEVCRMRGIPIFTFINKFDRPSQEPLELLSELEKVLGIRSCPMSWPLGSGDRFKGVFDRTKSEILVYQTDKAKATGKLASKVVPVTDAYDPKFLETIKQVSKDDYEANEVYKQFLEELELIDLAGDPFDQEKINRGQLTPVFFGSALNNFGVERFLEHFLEIAPPPAARLAKETKISPSEKQFSGFIFKIQANMDPKHRDRVSFLRVCSGTLERNMAVKHARLNKSLKLAQPLQFFGQERIVIDHAYPGDIVGLLDTTGNLRIGDTLCEGKSFEYNRVPSFSPEHFASVVLKDPLKRKQLKKGLDQLNEEGVIQLFFQKDYGDKDPILGAVGHLQFEVLTHRLLGEYGVKIQTHILPFGIARWLSGQGLKQSLIDEFDRREDSKMVYDRDQNPIVLFRSEWAFKWAKDNHTEVEFLNTPPF